MNFLLSSETDGTGFMFLRSQARNEQWSQEISI